MIKSNSGQLGFTLQSCSHTYGAQKHDGMTWFEIASKYCVSNTHEDAVIYSSLHSRITTNRFCFMPKVFERIKLEFQRDFMLYNPKYNKSGLIYFGEFRPV